MSMDLDSCCNYTSFEQAYQAGFKEGLAKALSLIKEGNEAKPPKASDDLDDDFFTTLC